MTGPLLEALASFEALRAVVVGDAMLDVYLHGRTGRLCPEAPVPVVAVGADVAAPGGAANAAVNLRALGAETILVSAVGDDAEGRRLLELLADRGVDAAATIVRPGRGTLTKTRVLADDHLLLRFDAGDVTPIRGKDERALRERLDELVADADLVLVSDYGYGVVTPGVISALPRTGPPVAVDAKDLAPYRTLGPTVVKPNFAQAARMLGG
ncbi:MAG: bifunctional heptose 7-phosphate kinase/heptose 1-phosphate adenyltransferase, partial [Candidatus Velamenicoccus archaeovorus]